MSNTDCIDIPTAPNLALTFAAADDDTRALLLGADALIAAVTVESNGEVVARLGVCRRYSTPMLALTFVVNPDVDPDAQYDVEWTVYGNWDPRNGAELAATRNFGGTGYWDPRQDTEALAAVIVDDLRATFQKLTPAAERTPVSTDGF